ISSSWADAVQSSKEFVDEGRFVKPNGKVVWIEIAAAPFSLLAGQPVSYIGTTVDITERIEAMKSLTDEQNLLHQSIELQDHERKLIAYDIHDGMIQYATGALWHLLGYQATVTTQDSNGLLESGIKALRQTVAE